MHTLTVAARLSFFAAAVAMTLAVFASATTLAGIEREAAIAHAVRAAASQGQVIVATGAPSRK